MTLRRAKPARKIDSAADQRRRELLAFLRSDRPAWQDQDHPELASGTNNFVRRLRNQSDRPSR